MGRFTAIDSPAVDALVADAVAKIGAAIDAMSIPRLAGVVLGGGYGRGEGGVCTDPSGGEHPYNDLDFYVVTEEGATDDERAAIDRALAPLSKEWTDRIGVDVDFCPAKTPWRIRHDQERLMIQELIHGYVDVAGKKGEELFKNVDRRGPDAFPWAEAVRLLVNRGVGLVLARESDDPAFIARNINKCTLGAGDAALIARHAYAWRVEDRANAFGSAEYRAAVEWKLRPRQDAPISWEAARELWLAAAEEVRRAGRGEKSAGRSLWQAVRWIVRRRTVGDLSTLGQEAVVRIFKKLEGVVRERAPLMEELRKDWIVFN